MTEPVASEDLSGPREIARGPRAAYDAVAEDYDARFSDELTSKPLDRAMLNAFVEMSGSGTVADVGCGPGHVTRYLSTRGAQVVGVDLSPGMIAVARRRAPDLSFLEGSLLALPAADEAWAGAVAFYSIIHLHPDERVPAFRELARVLRPGGILLVSFHVASPDFAAGEVNRLTEWFGKRVELDGYFLAAEEVVAHLQWAGFELAAKVDRAPSTDLEYPSQRCYLLAYRR